MAPTVGAVKEATGNVLRAAELVRRFGSRLTVLSGDDALTVPMVASGAKGVISVTSNVLPKQVSAMTAAALDGKVAAAQSAHLSLLPVHEAMFLEANPGPVKWALAARGIGNGRLRLPMVEPSEATQRRVSEALAGFDT